jgi:large subunit ribosomal protein L24
MLVDPASGNPTKVGYRFTGSGEKVRVAKGSGEDIDG